MKKNSFLRGIFGEGGALAWAVQIFLLIAAFVGNGILSAVRAIRAAVVKPAVSGFAKAWRWSRSSLVGRVVAEAVAFIRKTALRLFWGVWGRERCRYQRIRRWIVAPTLVFALLAAPIIGVVELVTAPATYKAWQIGTELFVKIVSSATVERGARNYDEKMKELNGHLVWTTIATGKDAEPTWMSQRDSWTKFLPELDIVRVYTTKSAFEEPNFPVIEPKRSLSNLPVHTYPKPINLVGYTLEYQVKSDGSSPSSSPNHSWYGPPMGWGGETEKDMEKYDKLIQKINGDGWVHDPGKTVIKKITTWAMSQQISVKSEFEFYRNDRFDNGVTAFPIDDLSAPGATSTFPCRLRYDIVKVGYGVWADRNNDGVEEWYGEIYYGDVVATVDEPIEMLSYKDYRRSVTPEEKVGDNQGIKVNTVTFNDHASRHLKKVEKYKCKFMNMEKDGMIRLNDLDSETLRFMHRERDLTRYNTFYLKCRIPENPQGHWRKAVAHT